LFNSWCVKILFIIEYMLYFVLIISGVWVPISITLSMLKLVAGLLLSTLILTFLDCLRSNVILIWFKILFLWIMKSLVIVRSFFLVYIIWSFLENGESVWRPENSIPVDEYIRLSRKCILYRMLNISVLIGPISLVLVK